jgi:hypothetical protein
MSSKSGPETPLGSRSLPDPIQKRSSLLSTGNGRNRKASIKLKTAAFAPIPRARLTTAVAASPRRLESQRRAVRQSRVMPDTESIINRGRWNQKHRDAEFPGERAPLLADCRPSLPPGRTVDLACGLGANALYLAE